MSEPLGEQFLEIVFRISSQLTGLRPVAVEDAAAAPVSYLFSLSSLSDSWVLLHDQWRRRKLSRRVLRDFTTSEHVDTYLSGISTDPARNTGDFHDLAFGIAVAAFFAFLRYLFSQS